MANNKNDKNPRNPDNSLYKRLTRIFSGPIINRRQQNYRQEKRRRLDKYKFKSASGQSFKKSEYTPFEHIQTAAMSNQNRAERYIDFDQMEYCLHGDTKIAVPGGYKTLKELSEEYGLEKEFIVYSYDHEKSEIVPALGRQARKTRTDHAWKVIFENGQEIIGTEDHRLMMRDGTYRTISQLKEGDALMPFYRKDLINTKTDDGSGYRWIYTNHSDEGRRPGWIAEHILIAEWSQGRRLEKDEVVHHINFIKNDNDPRNLVIMKRDDHLSYHQSILNEQRKREGWWEEFSKKHSQWMKENNPAERKDITFEVILSLCDQYGFNQTNLCKMLDTDPNTIKRRLKTKGFSSFEKFALAYDTSWKNSSHDNRGEKNPRYDTALTYQDICNAYEKGMSSNALAEKLDTTYMKIANRIKGQGYNNYSDWSESYVNHKVVKVEYYGFIDLYDLTVDKYKNFATDSVISHNTPEIASALDIYADEMTTSTSLEEMMRIDCANEEIKSLLTNLYHNVLSVNYNLFGWCRSTCKYGDFFLYLDVDEVDGIQNVMGLPTHEVERLEGEDKSNPNYLQFQWNSGGMTFENWQIAHFRILGNDKYAPYGTSVLEPARRIWRQLTLLEDAMMAYRIVRAPERRVFKIDVGNIAPQDVEQYMQKAVSQMKRNQVIDDRTGRVDLRYNPLSVEEDYFIPVRGGTSSTIESLPGGTYTGDIDDVKYLRDKLFSALKIPQSYLSRGEGSDEDKTTLAQKDIRFARTIQRLQRTIVTELEKIGIIHLYTLGFRGDDLLCFKLKLNNPSKIAELQDLEHWRTRFDVAGAATEGYFSRRWVAKELFGLSDEEFLRNQREMFYDRKFTAMLDSESEAVANEASGLGGGGGLGDLGGEEGGLGDLGGEEGDLGDLGGDEGGGDLGGDLDAEAPGGDAGAGEDSTLLAAPGKRDDKMTTTPKSKGKWYKPVAYRGGDRRNAGARKRHYNGTWNKEKGSSTKRNVMGAGYQELSSLSSGIYEQWESSYIDDLMTENVEPQTDSETQILEVNTQLKGLIKELERKDVEKEEQEKTQ